MILKSARGVAIAIAVVAALSACAPTEEAPIASPVDSASVTDTEKTATEPTPTPTTDAAYLAAVASYPRELPEGYNFPANLVGADAADKWWWCSQLDAAWEAYFNRDDEAAALGYLHAAAAVDPGPYGSQFDHPKGALPLNDKIDRDVRLIGSGVDSQYVEYTAHGCWAWAKSVGSEFAPLP